MADIIEKLGDLHKQAVVRLEEARDYIIELKKDRDMYRDAEMAWETAMMDAIGEDGTKSVAEAIAKLKAERDELYAAVEEMLEIKTVDDYNTTAAAMRILPVNDRTKPAHIIWRVYAKIRGAS